MNVGAGVSPDILYGTVPNTEKGFDLGPLTKNDSGRVWMVGFDLAGEQMSACQRDCLHYACLPCACFEATCLPGVGG